MKDTESPEGKASQAEVAVDAYKARFGEDDIESVLPDMIADFRHYCDVYDLDWDAIQERALRTYLLEKAEWAECTPD